MTKKNAEKCVIEWLFLSPLAIYAYHPFFFYLVELNKFSFVMRKKRDYVTCLFMEYAHPRSIG